MKKILVVVLCLMVLSSMIIYSPANKAAVSSNVKVWISQVNSSNTGMSLALTQQADAVFSNDTGGTSAYTFNIDENAKYQQMDGFGASMTESSAYLIESKLNQSARDTLMNNLFNKDTGIGISMLRQPIGAVDFAIAPYNYDPQPDSDDLPNFSINHDKTYIIPSLQQALSINPNIKITCATWSPPSWMKSNNSELGYVNGKVGTLINFPAYANYITKFIKAYQAENIPIWATTIQNEPDYASPNWPAMQFDSSQELDLVYNYLYPSFQKNNLTNVKIIGWDHNFSTGNYPNGKYARDILSADKDNIFAGTAWHYYGGDSSTLLQIHDAYPDKGIWVDECSGGEWNPVQRWHDGFREQMKDIISYTRRWAQSMIWWNIALDENNGPDYYYDTYQNTHSTCRGLVKINQTNGDITYNEDYYTMGHISKFVDAGAYRIYSNTYENNIDSVAFQNPDQSKALIVYNENTTPKTIKVKWGSQAFTYSIPAEAAATFTWSGKQDISTIQSQSVWFQNFENISSIDVVDSSAASTEILEQSNNAGGTKSVKFTTKTSGWPWDTNTYMKILPQSGSTIDVSAYNYFTFYVKDTFSTENFYLLMYDENGKKAGVWTPNGSSTKDAWSKVTIPLSSISPLDAARPLDLTKIKEIWIGQWNKGTYYFDDIYLSVNDTDSLPAFGSGATASPTEAPTATPKPTPTATPKPTVTPKPTPKPSPTATPQDTIAPKAPVVNQVGDNVKSITGKTEANATIYIKKSGKLIGSVKAKTDGSFTVIIPKQKSGSALYVTAKDRAGNLSKATMVIVKDKTPPAMPQVNTIKSSTKSVTGIAEAGAYIVIKKGSTVIGTGYANTNGRFSITIRAQGKGTVLYVSARDRARNVSLQRKVTVLK